MPVMEKTLMILYLGIFVLEVWRFFARIKHGVLHHKHKMADQHPYLKDPWICLGLEAWPDSDVLPKVAMAKSA